MNCIYRVYYTCWFIWHTLWYAVSTTMCNVSYRENNIEPTKNKWTHMKTFPVGPFQGSALHPSHDVGSAREAISQPQQRRTQKQEAFFRLLAPLFPSSIHSHFKDGGWMTEMRKISFCSCSPCCHRSLHDSERWKHLLVGGIVLSASLHGLFVHILCLMLGLYHLAEKQTCPAKS